MNAFIYWMRGYIETLTHYTVFKLKQLGENFSSGDQTVTVIICAWLCSNWHRHNYWIIIMNKWWMVLVIRFWMRRHVSQYRMKHSVGVWHILLWNFLIFLNTLLNSKRGVLEPRALLWPWQPVIIDKICFTWDGHILMRMLSSVLSHALVYFRCYRACIQTLNFFFLSKHTFSSFEAICSSIVLVLCIKTTAFEKWVQFLSSGLEDVKKFLLCWGHW